MVADTESWVKRTGRVVLFPVVLGAAMAGAIVGLQRGVDPLLLSAVTVVPVALIVAIGEFWLPFRRSWAKSRGDVPTDIAHALFSNAIAGEVIKTVLLVALVPAAAWLAASVDFRAWPNRWPLALQLMLALVVAELGAYWAHRIAHEYGDTALWRAHATHHSPRRLYWLNAGRDHPFGVVLLLVPEIGPLILMGAGEPVLVAFLIFTGVHGLFQHCNIDVRLGPLNWVFSMAELHRWHHSVDVDQANHNYGANLCLWDVVFGTRYLPKEANPAEAQAPRDVGIEYLPNFPEGYLRQLTVPFRARWRGLKAEGRLIRERNAREENPDFTRAGRRLADSEERNAPPLGLVGSRAS